MKSPLKKFNLPLDFGKFGAIRKYDIHTGIDLYCEAHSPVFSMEKGEVVRVERFTGYNVNSPWWKETWCVVIHSKSGFILYGEIEPKVCIGDKVKEGQLIGNVLTVLKKDKGNPTTMLHLELYDRNISPVEWKLDQARPNGLLDPSHLIK